MPAPRFLMCAPSFFGVQYVINPWMEGQIAHTDSSLAQAQWEQLRRLIAADSEVGLIPPVSGLPDLVFTANAALIFRDVAVLSSFRCEERRPEAPHYAEWLKAQNLRVVELPPHIYFEGAGDALLDREHPLLWAGYGFRSDVSAKPHLESAVEVEVQPLRLIDPRFYHLDTCFCPLRDGHLLYFPGAFDDASNAAIEARIAAEKRFAVPERDAVHFSCNAVNIGNRLISNHVGPETRAWLESRGFEVVTTPMTEFMKAGGAAKCLSLRLDETQH